MIHDLALVLFLAFLEGLLSVDNALVLALLARRLPHEKQRAALTYGLVGSVAFRLAALSLASSLMGWLWVKYAGGAYLTAIALRHLFGRRPSHPEARPPLRGFWRTVLLIELMDIAFAVDSILAAVAVSRRLWVVFTGGMLGVVLVRFAAGGFVRVLRRFPNFEATAYLMILVIGIKLFVEGAAETFRWERVDFQSLSSPGTWAFWGSMAACLIVGFRPKRGSAP